jgi:putative transposase
VAIIDWATRRVLSWRLSNTLTAGFCVEALSEALARFGKPGIFNRASEHPSVYVIEEKRLC